MATRKVKKAFQYDVEGLREELKIGEVASSMDATSARCAMG